MLKRQRSIVGLDSDVFSLIVPFLDDPRDLRATCQAFKFLFNATLPYQVELKPTTLRVLPAQAQLMVADFRLVTNSMPHVTALTLVDDNAPPDFYRRFPSMRALTCDGPSDGLILSRLHSFLPCLTSLNLSGQKLGKVSFDTPGLRRLNLSFCDVAPGWRPSFSPSLEDLSVRSSNIGLEGLALPRLTHLNVKDCPTEQLPAAPLRYLNCSFNYLSARFLASIPLRLEYLDCSNGEVEDFEDDYDPARVFDFTHLRHLKYLSTCGVLQRAIPQSVEVVRVSSWIPASMQAALDATRCVVLVVEMDHEVDEDDSVSGWNGGWDEVPREGARYFKVAC
jgi:hypothetical protein